jgi:hypothetical protein
MTERLPFSENLAGEAIKKARTLLYRLLEKQKLQDK